MPPHHAQPPSASGCGRARSSAGSGVRVHAAGYSAGGHRSARPSRRRAGSPPRPTNTKTGTGTGIGTGRVTGFRGGRSRPMRLRPTAAKRQPCPADRRGNARLGAVLCHACDLVGPPWLGGPEPRARGPRPGLAAAPAPRRRTRLTTLRAETHPRGTHGGQSSAPRLLGNSEMVSPGRSHRDPTRVPERCVLRGPGAVPSHRTSQERATGPPFGFAPAEPQRDGQRSAPSGTQRHRGRVPRSCPVTGHPAGMEARSRQAVPRADRPAERAGGPTRLPAAGQCSRGAGTTWSAPPGAPGPPV